MYKITFAPKAEEGLAKLKRDEPASFRKAVKLLNEIAIHPKTGTGTPGASQRETRKQMVPPDHQEAQVGISNP